MNKNFIKKTKAAYITEKMEIEATRLAVIARKKKLEITQQLIIKEDIWFYLEPELKNHMRFDEFVREFEITKRYENNYSLWYNTEFHEIEIRIKLNKVTNMFDSYETANFLVYGSRFEYDGTIVEETGNFYSGTSIMAALGFVFNIEAQLNEQFNTLVHS